MQMNRTLALALCVGTAASVTAAPAIAAKPPAKERIQKDLTADGKLKHCYTVKQLKKFKKTIGADLKQYSPETLKAVNKEIRYAKKHKINVKRKACQA